MTRSTKRAPKKQDDGVKTTRFPIGKAEIVVKEKEGKMLAALYLHSGKKRFTLEYETIDGYQPLVISEVLKERP